MRKCPSCGQSIADAGAFCSHCGAPLAKTGSLKKFCPQCGAECEASASFCDICGQSFGLSGRQTASDTAVASPEEPETQNTVPEPPDFRTLTQSIAGMQQTAPSAPARGVGDITYKVALEVLAPAKTKVAVRRSVPVVFLLAACGSLHLLLSHGSPFYIAVLAGAAIWWKLRPCMFCAVSTLGIFAVTSLYTLSNTDKISCVWLLIVGIYMLINAIIIRKALKRIRGSL